MPPESEPANPANPQTQAEPKPNPNPASPGPAAAAARRAPVAATEASGAKMNRELDP